MNRARSGEQRPTSRKTAADERQAERPPLLEQLLAEEDAEAGHRRPRRSRPHESRARRARPTTPARRARGTRPRGSAGPLERDEDDARGDDDREDLAGGRGGVRDGRPGCVPCGSVRRPVAHGAARRLVGQAGHRVALARRRHELEDRPGVGREQVVERALGHEPAAIEDRDAVADPLDVGEDVGRDDHGRRPAEPLDQLEQVPPALGVERADRLVEEQQLAARGSAPGRCRAAAASRRCTPPIRRSPAVGQAGPLEHLGDARPELGPLDPGQAGGQLEQLAALHPAVEPRILVDVADPPAELGPVVGRRRRRRRTRSRRSPGRGR